MCLRDRINALTSIRNSVSKNIDNIININAAGVEDASFNASVAEDVYKRQIIDTLNVIMIRLAEKRSPFEADKNHIHHKLLKLGLTHKRATFYIIIYYLLIISVAYLLRHIEVNALLIIILALGFLGAYLPDIFMKKNKI